LYKTDQLKKMHEQNNGYLFTSEVVNAGISKTYLLRYVRSNNFERVARGIYVSEDTWPDELFILQKSNPVLIFSRETALYLHGLTDKEYSAIHVSVPTTFNTYRLKHKGVKIHQYQRDLHELGIMEIQTNYNNTIRIYDRERCICDIIAARKDIEVHTFQTAIKEYMADNSKRLGILINYADRLSIRDEVMKYVEVML